MLDIERNIEKANSLLVIESRGRIKHTTKVKRKAEFLYELHEDKKAIPADLCDHPTTPEFMTALNEGLKEAQVMFQEVPHVKTDIIKKFEVCGWQEPWLYDFKWTLEMVEQENLDAETPMMPLDMPDMDDGRKDLSLAVAEQQAEASGMPVFDYGQGGEAKLPEPPHEDDTVLVELVGELEAQLVLADDVTARAGEKSFNPQVVTGTMLTPKGRFSKNSVVSRRNKCIGKGVKLDLGRLRKITLNGFITAAKREAENATFSMEAVEQEMKEVGPGDFIALAFQGEGKDSVWIQKVVRMRYEENKKAKRAGSKERLVRQEVLRKANLSDARSKNLTFLGSWLTPVPGKENLFTHNEAKTCMEPTANDFFPISAYLGHCDVAVHQSGVNVGKYFLSDATQMRRFMLDAQMLQTEGGAGVTLEKFFRA